MKCAPLALLALCSCAALPTGDSCSTDEQCDPGDSCRQGACNSDALSAGTGISLTPAEATVYTQTGAAPPAVQLDLLSADGAAHDFSISCAPGATATPSSGNVPGHVQVQIDAPGVRGAHIVTCAATSSSAPSVQSRITVVAAGFPPPPPPPSGIGASGGSVDLLDFVLTGDTRPGACNDTAHYPAAIHQQIVRAMAAVKPQLAVDLGDHMYACSQNAQAAQQQMALYTQPLAGFPSLFLMTMGNHECESIDCSSHTSDANYSAYFQALKQISRQTAANYALQIRTRLGRVTLAVVADNFFGAQQQTWLETTLADADAKSIATLVAKHHPVTGSRMGPAAPWNIIQKHRYSLVVTAHNHDYAHDTVALSGRSVICGLGGASSSHTGFCRIQQTADGQLHFTQYDASGNPHDTWAVAPR